MIINIILYLIIFLSVVGILVILSRGISRLEKLPEKQIKGIASKIKDVKYQQFFKNIYNDIKMFAEWFKLGIIEIGEILMQFIKWIGKKIILLISALADVYKKIKKAKEPAISKVEKFISEESPSTEQEKFSEILPELKTAISIADLEKPIQEEQKWIDMIVENPKNISAYKALGIFYFKQRNFTDARASLKIAVKLGSKDKQVEKILQELKNDNTTESMPS